MLTVDRNGLLWLTEFRHPVFNRAMELCSRAGDWDVWTGALLGMIALRGRPRRVGLVATQKILASLLVCLVLKRLAKRDRPSNSVEGFSTLLSDPDPYSFPSSHAATSWAGCTAIARECGGLGWLMTIPAILVSYSRIHVGAHYPLDVLIGTSIGLICGIKHRE